MLFICYSIIFKDVIYLFIILEFLLLLLFFCVHSVSASHQRESRKFILYQRLS